MDIQAILENSNAYKINSLLTTACRSNHLASVQQLVSIAQSKNFNIDIIFPCLTASYLHSPDILHFLLNTQTGKQTIASEHKYQFLEAACAEKKTHVIDYIMRLLADEDITKLNSYVNEHFPTWCLINNKTVINYLLDKNNNLIALDFKYKHYRAFNNLFRYENTLETIDYLLNNYHLKNNIIFPVNKGFISACKKSNLDIVSYLLTTDNLEHRVTDSDIISFGFIQCCKFEDLPIIEYLIINANIIITPNLNRYLEIHKQDDFIKKVHNMIQLNVLKNQLDKFSEQLPFTNHKKLKI